MQQVVAILVNDLQTIKIDCQTVYCRLAKGEPYRCLHRMNAHQSLRIKGNTSDWSGRFLWRDLLPIFAARWGILVMRLRSVDDKSTSSDFAGYVDNFTCANCLTVLIANLRTIAPFIYGLIESGRFH